MAHFAELDENNVVLRVVVIGDKDTADVNGVEKEHIGAAFCEKLFGGTWKQTSYNGNIRKRYAGKGMTFDADRDAFIPQKPYPSWVLNEETCAWEAPVSVPELTQEQMDAGSSYVWNEETTSWDLETL